MDLHWFPNECDKSSYIYFGDDYHNIKIKYEMQSDNCASYVKSYNSIICIFTN